MKKMMITLLVCVTITTLAKAQTAKFGFTAGGTLAWMRTVSENGDKSTSNTVPGFSAGVVGDLPVGKMFSFQPALSFTQKGLAESNNGIDLSMHLNYLELPLNFIYKAPGKVGHFLVGLGPTLSYGLSGTTTAIDNGTTYKGKVNFGSSDEDYKPLEFSGNILIGYEWKSGFFFQANYNMGFSNLFHYDSQYPSDPGSLKNSYVGLRFGYFLGRK
jgi:Outer membrane protein beta-barrel domain